MNNLNTSLSYYYTLLLSSEEPEFEFQTSFRDSALILLPIYYTW